METTGMSHPMDAYRNACRYGFNDKTGRFLFGDDWPRKKQLTIETIHQAIAVDASPINHILKSNTIATERLFPPWNTFCFIVKEDARDGPWDNVIDEELRSQKTVDTLILVQNLLKDKAEPWTRESATSRGPTDNFSGLGCVSIGGLHKKQPTIEFATFIPLNADGTRPTTNNPNEVYVSWTPQDFDIARLSKLQRQGFPLDALIKETQADAFTIGGVVINFINFMQCRNIKAKKMFFPDYKPRKKQRHKVYRYHELIVTKPTIQAVSQEHGEGVKGKALHLVRGHVARYTEAKPLFGISGLYGDFFIPQHTRGDLKYGKVDKSYKAKGL
jgi:hypothetical protein